MQTIHLFAVCKNDLFIRVASRLLYEKGIRLTGTCRQPHLAITQFIGCRPLPDIVLLDASWNNYDVTSADLIERFLTIPHSPPKIILTTNSYEQATICKLQLKGASGYFYRSSADPDVIFNCIHTVYTGKKWFQDEQNFNACL